MATISEMVDRAKRFRIYRNGDPQFHGKEFVLNKRRVRTWDSFLQQVTADVKFSEAVRSIRTPIGGTRVRSLDDLQDSKHYVAVGNSRFNRSIRYLELENQSRRINHGTSPRIMEVKPVEHSRIQVSGKIRKIPTDVLTIFVYSNGNELQQAKRITLTRQMLQNWDAILGEVTNRVGNLTTCLYTLDGTKITNPSSLEKNNFYVAVDKKFKKLDYGAQRPGFNTSPKQRRRLMPIMAPHRRGRKLRTGSDQTGRATMDNSVASSESEKSPKSYISTTSNPIHNRPAPNRRPLPRKIPEKKDDSVFHARPVKHKRNHDKVEEIDFDKDVGGVFKAKGGSGEAVDAKVIEETEDTKVDLPIDEMKAEEVEEEEIEAEPETKEPSREKKANRKNDDRSTSHGDTVGSSSRREKETHRSPTPAKRTPTPPTARSPANQTARRSSSQQSNRSAANGPASDRAPSHASDGLTNLDAPPTDTPTEDNKENEAATKIQANYRGYKTRKGLPKGQKEESTENDVTESHRQVDNQSAEINEADPVGNDESEAQEVEQNNESEHAEERGDDLEENKDNIQSNKDEPNSESQEVQDENDQSEKEDIDQSPERHSSSDIREIDNVEEAEETKPPTTPSLGADQSENTTTPNNDQHSDGQESANQDQDTEEANDKEESKPLGEI